MKGIKTKSVDSKANENVARTIPTTVAVVTKTEARGSERWLR